MLMFCDDRILNVCVFILCNVCVFFFMILFVYNFRTREMLSLEYPIWKVIAQIFYLLDTNHLYDDFTQIKYNMQELLSQLIECVLNYICSD